jgi:hypothetical protein
MGWLGVKNFRETRTPAGKQAKRQRARRALYRVSTSFKTVGHKPVVVCVINFDCCRGVTCNVSYSVPAFDNPSRLMT